MKASNLNGAEGHGTTTYALVINVSRLEVKYGVRSPKFIWAPVYSCTHWLRPRNSPAPPAFGLVYEYLLISQDRRHWYLWWSSYGGKLFSNIFISMYVTLNWQTDMSTVAGNITKCSQGPYRAVQCAFCPNKILCTG
jgi:hypothetical protein